MEKGEKRERKMDEWSEPGKQAGERPIGRPWEGEEVGRKEGGKRGGDGGRGWVGG